MQNPNPAAVVMKLNLPVESLPEVVEQFTIDFCGTEHTLALGYHAGIYPI